MPADSELWIPPLSPKNQKGFNRQHRRRKLIKWSGFADKTPWDLIRDLLGILLVPLVIAGATIWFSAQQSESSTRASDKQHQTDLQIAQDQQQETALQTYLDRMSDLLLNNKLRESQPGDEVRNVAQVRTLTVLQQLDSKRKVEIVQFLYESGLIDKQNIIVSLGGVDLSGVDLSGVDLSGAYLGGVNISGANLIGTDLSRADLFLANLSGAVLFQTTLVRAKLIDADLSQAKLVGANFARAELMYAHLSGADLTGADFENASLAHATGTTPGQLSQAWLLQGATMPDGSIHP